MSVAKGNSEFRRDLMDRFKQARVRLDMTRPEFAEAIDVKFHTYRSWERGISTPSLEAVEKLVGMGISAEWLITGQGPMTSNLPPSRQSFPEEGDINDALFLKNNYTDLFTVTVAVSGLLEYMKEEGSELAPDDLASAVVGLISMLRVRQAVPNKRDVLRLLKAIL